LLSTTIATIDFTQTTVTACFIASVESLKLLCTDKKENKIFLIFKEIQKGAVAKSYMASGLLILNICAFPSI
jgi:hypothetical protein